MLPSHQDMLEVSFQQIQDYHIHDQNVEVVEVVEEDMDMGVEDAVDVVDVLDTLARLDEVDDPLVESPQNT